MQRTPELHVRECAPSRTMATYPHSYYRHDIPRDRELPLAALGTEQRDQNPYASVCDTSACSPVRHMEVRPEAWHALKTQPIAEHGMHAANVPTVAALPRTQSITVPGLLGHDGAGKAETRR